MPRTFLLPSHPFCSPPPPVVLVVSELERRGLEEQFLHAPRVNKGMKKGQDPVMGSRPLTHVFEEP
jgi:hypothetical protein